MRNDGFVEDERELEFEEIEALYDWWHDFVIDQGSLLKALRNVTLFYEKHQIPYEGLKPGFYRFDGVSMRKVDFIDVL